MFTTSAAKACPSISGATTTSGLPSLATISRTGKICSTLSIFSSTTNIKQSSYTTAPRLSSVTNAAAAYPESSLNPSTRSRLVFRDLASSTVILPSLPTLSTAMAIRSPISLSLLAEIIAIWRMSSMLETGTAKSERAVTTCSTVESRALLISIGEWPEAIYLLAFLYNALASTVAVVVPSPASELVTLEACFTIWAPTSSKGSSSSTNSATVTPSLVTIGLDPVFLRITLLPLGPSVDATLSANLSTPTAILEDRASSQL